MTNFLYNKPGRPEKNNRVTLFELKHEGHVSEILKGWLRANPMHKIRVPGKQDTRRMGVIDEAGQVQWLHEKAKYGAEPRKSRQELVPDGIQRAGFRVLSASVVREDAPEDIAKGFKQNGPDRQKLSLLAVRYDGILQITDSKEFLRTIQNGIGPGKAFGFGLLSLAPV